MYQRGALTLFHVKGVPIRAHWTLLLVLPYLAFALSADFDRVATSAGIASSHLVGPPLLWGAVLALLLFVSVGVHELAHSLVAIARGGRVRDITLMLLGGVSHFERIPERPATEALVAAVGPATSLGLAGLLFVTAHLLGQDAGDVRLGVFYLAYMNLVLGAFNLIPAFPMDGGRVLRALLALRTSRMRATDIAATVGMTLAVPLGLIGLVTGGFFLVLIAIFVFFGAKSEAQGERVREMLAGLQVADLVSTPPTTIALDEPLDEVLPRMRRLGRTQLVVVDARSRFAGVVRADDVVAAAGAAMRVGDLGDKLAAGVLAVSPREDVTAALQKAAQTRSDTLVVLDASGTAVALLGLPEIEQAIRLHALASRTASHDPHWTTRSGSPI
jgi:Zn-dependent protease/CBS domain-containing protein